MLGHKNSFFSFEQASCLWRSLKIRSVENWPAVRKICKPKQISAIHSFHPSKEKEKALDPDQRISIAFFLLCLYHPYVDICLTSSFNSKWGTWHFHRLIELFEYLMLTSRKVFRSIRVFAEQGLLNNTLVEPWKLTLHWMTPWKNSYLSSFWLILGKNIEIFSTAIRTTACSHSMKSSLEFRFWRWSVIRKWTLTWHPMIAAPYLTNGPRRGLE